MLKKLAEGFARYTVLDYLLISLFVLLSYGALLGLHPLLVPDEARYSEVAREMLAMHQYVTPQVNGIDFFDKPILFYWLQVLSMAIFGVNEWAIRLMPMLVGLVGLLVVFFTCKQLYQRRTAWIATLVLASCPLYYFSAHYANLDLEVAVWITTSLCFFLCSYQPTEKTLRPGFLYLSYAAAALAILTKGLIGIVFPMMVIGVWILFTGQWYLLRKMRIFTGFLLILAVVLPWFILVAHRNPGFMYYFFYIQQVLRFLTKSFNNGAPFWFYLPVVLVGLLPWSPFLFKSFKAKNIDTLSAFFIIWALVIFIFFSIPHSKLIGYIIPVIPPLAILIGCFYDTYSEQYKQKVLWGYVLVIILADLAICLVPAHLKANLGITMITQLIVFTVLTVLALVIILLRRAYPKAIFSYMMFANIVIFNLVLATFVIISPKAVTLFFPIKTLAADLKPILTPEDQLVSYYTYYQDLPIYTGHNVWIVHNWDKPDLAKVDNWRGEFAYSMQYLQPEAKNTLISPEQFASAWQKPGRLFVFIPKHKLELWYQQYGKLPNCVVAQADKITVLTNDVKLCS